MYNVTGDYMYSNDLVCDIIKYIDNNINKKITINDLVEEFHFDRFHIMKSFKKELNISIIDYINNTRILNSIKSLQSSNTILKIALDNGYYSQEYFSEIFNRTIGISPIKYKKLLKNKNTFSKHKQEKVLNNILKLQELNEFKTKYLKKQKPKTNKVLSIFK